MRLFDEAKSGKVREAVHALVKDWPGVEAKPMMGCPGWRANGALFASVIDDGVMLHALTTEQIARAKTAVGGGPFRPDPKRAVNGWLVVPLQPSDVGRLAPWLERSYVGALEKKGKKGKTQATPSGAVRGSARTRAPGPSGR